MAKYGMVLDLNRCLGCYTCVAACEMCHGTRPGVNYNGVHAVEWGDYPNAKVRYQLTMCMHCENPACVAACPVSATYRSEEGAVVMDYDKCIGCGACITACPYNQRTLVADNLTSYEGEIMPYEQESAKRVNVVEKCTFCYDRVQNGVAPMCTSHCPAGCRVFGDVEDPKSDVAQYISAKNAVQLEGARIWYVLPDDMPEEYRPKTPEQMLLTSAGAITPGASGHSIPFPEEIKKVAAGNPDASEEIRYTHCAMCNSMPKCGIKAVVKDNRIIRIERRDGYPNANICSKGVAAIQDMYNPDRLRYPLKRTTPKGSGDPNWKRITWEEAVATIAEKLNAVKERYGADKVLFSTGDPKEPRPILQRLAFTFGSPNYGTESSTCFVAAQMATSLLYGKGRAGIGQAVGSNPIVGKTKVTIVWGSNPAWSMPFSMANALAAKETGTKFIVVDPRITPTASTLADVHLRVRPGTDCALALCFGNALIENDVHDHQFIESWAHGFDEYKELCAQYPVEKTAEICQISARDLQAAVDTLVSANGPITVKSSAAFPQHVNGISAYRAIMSLVPLSGSLDVAGGHILANPVNMDTPFSLSMSVQPKLDAMRVDRQYLPVWAELSKEVQLNYLPEYVKEGKIRAAFMLGQNAMMWPQSHEYQKAFEDMEFAVTADFYLNSWTHDYVDMVLPAAMSFERACPLTVFGRKVFLREPVVKPLGEARPDWEICCDVGTALGYSEEFFGGGSDSEENCIREYLRLLGAGVTLEDLRAAGADGVVIPADPLPEKQYTTGALRQDGQPGFPTPSGKVEFSSMILAKHGIDPLPVYKEPTQSPVSTPEVAKEYPLILNTGNRAPMFCHSKQRNLPWLRSLMPEPIVRMYPGDAQERNISQGDKVVISTQFGQITAKAELSQMIKPGCMDMFHGWPQANANELYARDFDPISGFPSFKEGLCQIRKAP